MDFQSEKSFRKLRLRAFQPYHQILCMLKHVEDVEDNLFVLDNPLLMNGLTKRRRVMLSDSCDVRFTGWMTVNDLLLKRRLPTVNFHTLYPKALVITTSRTCSACPNLSFTINSICKAKHACCVNSCLL